MINTEMKVFYQDDSYLVSSAVVDPDGIFVATFSSWDKGFHFQEPRGFERYFGADSILATGLNVVQLITSRNDWYANPTIEQALLAAREAIGSNPCITYGSSMGGYAAIRFSEELNASFVVSISPQYSLNKSWLAGVGDKRWAKESDFYDGKIPGPAFNGSGPTGLLFFDGKNVPDAMHAKAYAEFDNLKQVDIEYGGHPVGSIVNKCYGLKRILASVSGIVGKKTANPSADIGGDIDALCADIGNSHRSSNLYKFATAENIEEIALAYRDLGFGKLPLSLIQVYFARQDLSILQVVLGCQILNKNINVLAQKPNSAQRLLRSFATVARDQKIDVRPLLDKKLLEMMKLQK